MLTSGLLEYLTSLKSFFEYLTIHEVYVNENQTLRVLRLHSGKNRSQLIVATDYKLLQSSDWRSYFVFSRSYRVRTKLL